MSLQIKGMQELIDYYEKQARVKVSKTALKSAGELVLQVEKKVASRRHFKYARPQGVNSIKRFPIRNYHGSAFVDIGLKNKGGDEEWEKIKGIYFNHYGFFHNKSGNYIAGSRWMDTAFDESIEQAYAILAEGMYKELDL